VSLQVGDQTIEKTIENGRFELEEALIVEGDFVLKTSEDGVFWRKIKFSPSATP
jgi:hypothetical protein